MAAHAGPLIDRPILDGPVPDGRRVREVRASASYGHIFVEPGVTIAGDEEIYYGRVLDVRSGARTLLIVTTLD